MMRPVCARCLAPSRVAALLPGWPRLSQAAVLRGGFWLIACVLRFCGDLSRRRHPLGLCPNACQLAHHLLVVESSLEVVLEVERLDRSEAAAIGHHSCWMRTGESDVAVALDGSVLLWIWPTACAGGTAHTDGGTRRQLYPSARGECCPAVAGGGCKLRCRADPMLSGAWLIGAEGVGRCCAPRDQHLSA